MRRKSKRYTYRFIKRVFDIFVSLIGLLFFIPLLLIVKILFICTKDKGSLFFTQERIGLNGKLFKLYKFRTMHIDADKTLKQLLDENPELKKEYKRNKKLKNDPRITKIGNLLRKTSLDEYPQIFNIFTGKMSLIGNRPYLPREKKDMGKYYSAIVSTKPGLTGLWQVSGRSNISFKERLKLEKYYSNHCSFKMDIKIFFKTVKVILSGLGAR